MPVHKEMGNRFDLQTTQILNQQGYEHYKLAEEWASKFLPEDFGKSKGSCCIFQSNLFHCGK